VSRGAKKEKTLAKELGTFLAKTLVPDLRTRADAAAVAGVLRQRWEHERSEERTAEPFDDWREGLVEQVGAAWILSCVFVRTLEDRNLVPRRRLAGEGAADSEHYFYELAPSLNARDYLLTVFKELSRFPGTEALLGPKGNAAWRLAPSGPLAQALLDFFRETKEEGSLKWTFAASRESVQGEAPDASSKSAHPERSEPGRASEVEGRALESSTRFLGDLYQDLSESVRERYALLQTPDFVERFILGLTLDPAIGEFGLEEVRVIDPTCGSGHFLLGAYDRLFEARLAAQPGLDRRQHALAALEQVFGVDINPYAVAIARFRLTLAFLEKAGLSRLADAPKLPSNLVVADSLLYGARGANREFSELAPSKKEWGDALFTLEEPERALEVLSRGYHVVVGNPPYITCKDDLLRDKYRHLYGSCHKLYALGVPFTERFFQLAVDAGFIGLINANSFMKREFGKKLIDSVLPKLDLTHVIDTSGAYIPGHGTPTVILAGRNREPVTDKVRAVLGKRGEPETPEHPERGQVWLAIANHINDVGFDNSFVNVEDVAREDLAAFPWSLSGGGAGQLKEQIDRSAATTLGQIVDAIGRSTHTGEDNAFFVPAPAARRLGIPERGVVPLVTGEQVRDWVIESGDACLFPYDLETAEPRVLEERESRYYWSLRTSLRSRSDYGEKIEHRTVGGRRLRWCDHSMFFPERYRARFAIGFAFVATHNHFVLDRGGKVFKQSAPIIKLPAGATEEDHLALLGYLNSSTACFWMKQVFHPKYGAQKQDHPDPARFFYEFTGTGLGQLPIPLGIETLTPLAKALCRIASERAALLDRDKTVKGISECQTSADVKGLLARRWREADELREKMVFLQEEIDWRVYALFGLVDARVALPDETASVSPLARGMRAFEQIDGRSSLVRKEGRLLSTDEAEARPISRFSAEFDAVWNTRKQAIHRVPTIRFIERPVFKRLWRDTEANVTEFVFREATDHNHCNEYLLDVVERRARAATAPVTVREAAHVVRGDAAAAAVAEVLAEAGAQTVDATVEDLVRREAVPHLSAERFSAAGVEKHAMWQRTWDLQRREDAGEIPVPPKYDQKDYREAASWVLLGKLDVPKERFISYPGAERDDDKSPLIGWAGWDHLQRAQALAALYQERKNQDGWEKARLRPLLSGLLELVPWLKQWHNAPDEDPAKDRAGDAYASFVEAEAMALGYTLDDLKSWRPEERRGRRSSAVSRTPSPQRSPPAFDNASEPASRGETESPPAKKRGRKKKQEAETAE
jgi:hypothetical protein